jgi:probable HAF family extracellular repeat protein
MKLTTLIGFVLLLVTVASAQVYTITDLGQFSPTAINALGQVAGNYNGQANIWSFGRRTALGLLPGGSFSWAAAINDSGVVTGTADGPGQIVSIDGGSPIECSDLIQPFVWTPQKKMLGLGTAGPASDDAGLEDNGCPYPFYGAAINDHGQIVGYTGQLTDVFQWVVLWTNQGGMSIFGSSFWNTYGNGISNNGQIVGENGRASSGGDATYWKNGIATDLGGLPGIPPISGSAANGVNDLGQIVGWSFTPLDGNDQSFLHAVMWTQGGTISDLGTLPGDTDSSASKINFFGLVIGSSGNTVDHSTILGGQDSGFDVGPLEVIGRPCCLVREKRDARLEYADSPELRLGAQHSNRYQCVGPDCRFGNAEWTGTRIYLDAIRFLKHSRRTSRCSSSGANHLRREASWHRSFLW